MESYQSSASSEFEHLQETALIALQNLNQTLLNEEVPDFKGNLLHIKQWNDCCEYLVSRLSALGSPENSSCLTAHEMITLSSIRQTVMRMTQESGGTSEVLYTMSKNTEILFNSLHQLYQDIFLGAMMGEEENVA